MAKVATPTTTSVLVRVTKGTAHPAAIGAPFLATEGGAKGSAADEGVAKQLETLV